MDTPSTLFPAEYGYTADFAHLRITIKAEKNSNNKQTGMVVDLFSSMEGFTVEFYVPHRPSARY